MTNILLTISYDGTDFCGWQRQDFHGKKNWSRTVQGEIEEALQKMLRQPVPLYGSGRTDSGVHAAGQAANFLSPVDSVPEKNYIRALNSILPKDIRIMDSKKVDESFNSRFNATSRVYRYFILPQKVPQARDSRYVWCIPNKPDVKILNDMCSLLKGELDFSAFAASGDKSLSTFRYIEGACFRQEGELLVFEIEANAFLWKMVRSITGTLIGLEQKGGSKEDFRSILESCDRRKAGVTAPPEGLFLWQVKFDGVRRHA